VKRPIAVIILGLLALPAATARAGSLDARVGAFFPRAESNLFDDDAELYTVENSDWRGISGGIEYSGRLVPNVEFGLHLDGYGRTVHTSYRDFVRESGREITQSLKLNIVPLGLSVRLVPTSRRASFAPYVAAGVDLYYWRYEEFGDFVDFDDPDLPVIGDAFVSEGVAPGFHVAAGLRVPLNRDFSLTGEVRYNIAKDDMGDDFRGNRIDLGGVNATLGVHIRF
jgi:hypothetical protein